MKNLPVKTATMKIKILQWNVNGLGARFEFLQKLHNDNNFDILCIQETNFKNNFHKSIKGYKCYFKNRSTCVNASGGVAIYVHESIVSSEVQITSNLEVIIVKLFLGTKSLYLCNIYIPNSFSIDSSDLQNFIQQVNLPLILVGDFNSHNINWGSDRTDSRGKIVGEFIDNEGLVLLNESNKPTHFTVASGGESIIDLSLCSPNLVKYLEWIVLKELHNSDHYPIILVFQDSPEPEVIHSPRWKFKKANWKMYEDIIQDKIKLLDDISLSNEENIDIILDKFEELIITAAEKTIPKTIVKIGKRNLPWWTNVCEDAVRKYKHLFNIYKKCNTFENKILFKSARARARRIIKEAKRNCWRDFLSSLTSKISSKEAWDKINAINGKKRTTVIKSITSSNGNCIHDSRSIANSFGKLFASNSSDLNYEANFISHKQVVESSLPNLEEETSDNDDLRHLNTQLTLSELHEAISKLKETSAGPDGIPNIFIKKLPLVAI